jgi:lambda family phage minor tail protein L
MSPTDAPLVVQNELQSLAPSAIIELYQLHLTKDINGIDSILYYHAGTNELKQDIIFNSQTYSAVPCKVEGFSKSSKGLLPRPSFTVANANSAISNLIILYNPLRAKFVRVRTCRKFLDAANFTGGNASADPTAIFEPSAANSSESADVWYIDRVSSENKTAVQFELTSKLDLFNLQLPTRQILEYCPWKYRGQQCGYTGTAYFDINDDSVGSEDDDICGHRYTSCRVRHPVPTPLPFGGFPSARLQM